LSDQKPNPEGEIARCRQRVGQASSQKHDTIASDASQIGRTHTGKGNEEE